MIFLQKNKISCIYINFVVASLETSAAVLRENVFEKHLGLRDVQNLYLNAFYSSPLLNSSHFLTLISVFGAMIRVPGGIASNADRLQLDNKALWFSMLL